MLDIKGSADYLSRSTGSFSNFSMLFAGNNNNNDSKGFLSFNFIGIRVKKTECENKWKTKQNKTNEIHFIDSTV